MPLQQGPPIDSRGTLSRLDRIARKMEQNSQEVREKLDQWRELQQLGREDLDQGLLTDSLQFYKEACLEAEGLQPLYGLIAINNVAVARRVNGDRQRAKELLENAVVKAISEPAWVEPQAALLNNLGVIYHRQGQLGPARRYYQEALQILAEHTISLDISVGCLCNLADLNLQQSKATQAESLLKRARQLIERQLGVAQSDDSKEPGDEDLKLAGTAIELSEREQALAELQCRVQVGLGWVGVAQQRLARAEASFVAALRKGSRNTVRSRVLEARAQVGLADVYSRQSLALTRAAGDDVEAGFAARTEKLEQAELFFTESLSLLTALGDLGRHPYFEGAASYIDHLIRSQRFEEADSWINSALPWLDTMYGGEHPTVLAYLENLVLVLRGRRRDPEALQLEQSLVSLRQGLKQKESAYFQQNS
jgi:tetratricopeptide (TPR) repeat protein